MPEADEVGRLRLEAPRAGSVAETAEYLAALDACYRHLTLFHEWVDDVRHWERRMPFPFPVPWIVPLPDVPAATEPALRIAAVEIHSPGIWEFLGALVSIEAIRKYLDDRYQRQRDRDWRDPLDIERKRLENEQLRNQVVADRIRILRDLGVPRATIRQMVAAHVTQPLATLDRFQDAGLIGGVLAESGRTPTPAAPSGLPLPAPTPDVPRRPRRKISDDDEPIKAG